MFRRLSTLVLLSITIIAALLVNSAHAQQLDCSDSVKKTLQTTSNKCDQITRDTACYGGGLITAESVNGAQNFNFQAPGDIVDVSDIKSLRMAPLDPKGAQWGVAYLRIQANLPDTTAGQYVTMLIFGDSELQNLSQEAVVAGGGKSSIQSIYFSNGFGSPTCHNAPTSGMIIQAPAGAQTVALTVDGVQLGVNSTVFIQAPSAELDKLKPIGAAKTATATKSTQNATRTPTSTPTRTPTSRSAPASTGPKLKVTTIQGHVSVTVKGHTKVLTNGQSASVQLSDQGDAPADGPVLEAPSDDLKALIGLTDQPGVDDSLFLTTPDLNATEPFMGTDVANATDAAATDEAMSTSTADQTTAEAAITEPAANSGSDDKKSTPTPEIGGSANSGSDNSTNAPNPNSGDSAGSSGSGDNASGS